jgi:hypothetical protein
MAEGFLARWARLKRTSGEPSRPEEPLPGLRPDDEPQRSEIGEEEGGPAAPWVAALDPAETSGCDAATLPEEPAEPEPLPPVESLSAGSDYRPFLKPSVPDALRFAALRKAWSTDPEIAAFRGFADYDWDFNAPGYGKLLPIDDVAKLRDAIFGDRPAEPRLDEPAADAPAPPPGEEEGTPPEPALVAEAAEPAEPASTGETVALADPDLASLPEAAADRRDTVDRG